MLFNAKANSMLLALKAIMYKEGIIYKQLQYKILGAPKPYGQSAVVI